MTAKEVLARVFFKSVFKIRTVIKRINGHAFNILPFITNMGNNIFNTVYKLNTDNNEIAEK